MDYDDVILQIGEFGRYQRRIFLILCLPAISCGIYKMSGVFLVAQPDFRCLLPYETQENATYQLPSILANLSYPWDYNSGRWSQCERYDHNLTDQYHNLDENRSSTPLTVKCNSFVYDKSQYTLTATTEWNLVCDNVWLGATSNAIFMVGEMLGSIIFGDLSDRFGRSSTFVLALIMQLISGLLVAVSPDFISYMIFRLIIGLTTSGAYLIVYVIALEIVGPKKRLAAGTACHLCITTGAVSIAGLAYFITNWRMLELAFAVPSLTFVVYWWLAPESGRWLLSQGRVQEAQDILRNAAIENGVELSEDILNSLWKTDSKTTSSHERPSVLDLMRHPSLRRKSLLLFFLWFVNSGTYYGLSWNTSNLSGNEFINYGINAAVEIPGYMLTYFTLDKCGRKIILCGSMLLAAMSLLLTLCVPADMPWLIVGLAIFGKLIITSSYGAVYVFTAEQYPTGIRNVGLGACSTFARVGGVLAPYINHLSQFWTHLPLTLLGFCALIAGLLSLFLPETSNTKLPESIENGEQFVERVSETKQDMKKSTDCYLVQSSTVPDVKLQI